MSESENEPKEPKFFSSVAPNPSDEIGSDSGASRSAQASARIRKFLHNPIVVPAIVVMAFVVGLAVTGRAVQASRLAAAQLDFDRLIQDQCVLISSDGEPLDFDALSLKFDEIARRGAKSSSGIFGQSHANEESLEEKASGLSSALISVSDPTPSASRHAAFVRLAKSFAGQGVGSGCADQLQPIIEQDLTHWEHWLVKDGGSRSDDGRRAEEWEPWIEQLGQFEKVSHRRAERARHEVLSVHLDEIEGRWSRDASFNDYGEQFARFHSIYEKLSAHGPSAAGKGPTCKDRFDAASNNLFSAWKSSARNASGPEAERIASQFDDWAESAAGVGEFRSVKMVVDRNLASR